jgi:hypothetical protein
MAGGRLTTGRSLGYASWLQDEIGLLQNLTVASLAQLSEPPFHARRILPAEDSLSSS